MDRKNKHIVIPQEVEGGIETWDVAIIDNIHSEVNMEKADTPYVWKQYLTITNRENGENVEFETTSVDPDTKPNALWHFKRVLGDAIAYLDNTMADKYGLSDLALHLSNVCQDVFEKLKSVGLDEDRIRSLNSKIIIATTDEND